MFAFAQWTAYSQCRIKLYNVPTTSSLAELEGYGMERISLNRITLDNWEILFWNIAYFSGLKINSLIHGEPKNMKSITKVSFPVFTFSFSDPIKNFHLWPWLLALYGKNRAKCDCLMVFSIQFCQKRKVNHYTPLVRHGRLTPTSYSSWFRKLLKPEAWDDI